MKRSSWLIWMDPKSNGKCLYIRNRGDDTQREGAEEMKPSSKAREPRSTGSPRKLEDARRLAILEPQEGVLPADTVILDFHPLKLWKDKLMFHEGTQFMAFHTAAAENRNTEALREYGTQQMWQDPVEVKVLSIQRGYGHQITPCLVDFPW